MSKRFLAAIAGIVFGATMATAANAREHGGIPTSAFQHSWDDDDDDGERQVRSERKYRKQATKRSQQATPRTGGKQVGQQVSKRSTKQASQQAGKQVGSQSASQSAKQSTNPSTKQARRGGGRPIASAGGGMRNCLTPAARALLGRIEAQFGPMQIISTCRPGATIAGTGRISRHASGNAIDFNAGGRKAAVVRWLIANHKSGGTMTYADMSHIHVDVGPHFVSLNAHGG